MSVKSKINECKYKISFCLKNYFHPDKLIKCKNNKSKEINTLIYQQTSGIEGLFSSVATILGYFDYCKKHKINLIIDMKNYKNSSLSNNEVGIVNAWNYYYQELSPISLDEAYKNNYYLKPNTTIFGLKYLRWVPRWFIKLSKHRAKIEFPTTVDYIYDKKKFLKYCGYYNDSFKLSSDVIEYVEKEYSSLFPNNQKVLGIVYRSTDYTQAKPFGHHIQPTDEELINQIKIFLDKYDYKFIYLASDSEHIVHIINNRFQNIKIITNKRVYYDKYDFKNTNLANTTVEGATEFFRNISYFSSINLVSRCDSLIAGLCCGSQLALIMNNNKYEYVHLFNLGYYGIKGKF